MKSSTKTSLAVSLSLLFGLIGFQCAYNTSTEIQTTPEAVRYGWSPEAVADTAEWAAAQGPFVITDDAGNAIVQDNANADVRLWKSVTTAAGTYPDNFAQEIGDCTGFGMMHATQATEGSQIAAGQPATFHQVHPSFSYGAARVLILNGRFKNQDGCSGAALAKSATIHGLLPMDAPSVPGYTGNLSRDWGRNGPPKEMLAIAAAYKVKTVARLLDSGDARNSICNGYGCTIATTLLPDTHKEQDGRIVMAMRVKPVPRGQLPPGHQMCLDGYDGTAASGPKFHVQNSWGPKAHPQPMDDSPAGGFWITDQDCDRIVKQGDSWAYSGFDGFPQQDLDLKIFGASKP